MISDVQSLISKSDALQTQKTIKTPSFLSPTPSRSIELNYQNTQNSEITPLYQSILNGNLKATQTLLSEGADPNIKCKLGETPLFQAVEMNNISQVAALLTHKADPNIVNDEGISPLHIAVLKGNMQIISLLLKSGANPNLQLISTGQTPFHYAYQQYPYEETVSILTKFGALNNIRDKSNKKPSDYKEKGMLYSENNNNTNQENTFILENHLNFFETTKNKDDQSKGQNTIEGNENNQSNINVISNQMGMINSNNIFSELQNDNSNAENFNSEQTPKREDNCKYDCTSENDFNLNDSLEEDYELNYSKSKSYYVSDFPLSSMKKENIIESTNSNKEINQNNETLIGSINIDNNNEDDNMYKMLIIAKRNNFCNNKISHHCKANDIITNNNIQNDNKINVNNINSKKNGNIPLNTIVSNTCIHNNERNLTNSNSMINNKLSSYLNSTSNNANQNLTDIEINPYLTIIKQNDQNDTPLNQYNSNYSTTPQSNRIFSSLHSQKKFKSPYSDKNTNTNDSYEKVSEFTINKNLHQNSSIADKGYNEENLTKLKKWLHSIELSQYINNFIENGYIDITQMITSMKSYDKKMKYEDFDIIGIKKPGHIYRIITKLEIDCGLIDSKVIQFILPFNKIGIYSLETSNLNSNKVNLQISNEYCCSCISAKRTEVKKDLKFWLRKYKLMNYYPNFTHNGFDNLELIILQLYSTYPINDEILENCFHIYEESEREKVLESLMEEMKKINTFINSKEYSDNPYKFRYTNIQLEKEDSLEDEENCNACIIC